MTNHVKKTIKEIINLYVLISSNVFGENNQYKTECWNWVGALDTDGYGQLTYRHKHFKSHRFLYEYWTNTKLGHQHLDHLCRNRRCVNPYHIEPVTLQENLRRGVRASKTQCDNGHDFDNDNTYITKSGWRQCRICKKLNQAAYMERKNA